MRLEGHIESLEICAKKTRFKVLEFDGLSKLLWVVNAAYPSIRPIAEVFSNSLLSMQNQIHVDLVLFVEIICRTWLVSYFHSTCIVIITEKPQFRSSASRLFLLYFCS